jgi:hypothetical protein
VEGTGGRAWGLRLGRRGLLRGSVAAAALGSLGGVLLPLGTASAAPPVTAGQIKLLVSIGFQGSGQYAGEMQALVDAYIEANWTRKHPGVAVTTTAGGGSNGPNVGATAEIAASLAGSPEDVITGCCGDWYTFLNANAFRPLDAFIKQDNLDLTVFSPGHLAGLTTAEQGVLALPEYDGPQVVAVNLGMLDQLGLKAPSEQWDYLEAEALWRNLAGTRNGQWVQGMNFTRFPDPWAVAAWGGSYGNATHTVCELDSPKALAAFEWFYPLIWSKVVGGAGSPGGSFAKGTAAMKTQAGWDIESDLLGWRGMNWRYYPMPAYPAGPSTFINNDFYAINAYSKNPPELVWSIFKFVVLDRGFQQLLWRTTFITPNQVPLWPDWQEMLQRVAPPLRDANIGAMAASVNFGHSHFFWKYQDPTAEGIVSNYFNEIYAQKLSIQEGLRLATAQVNALQSASAVAYAKEQAYATAAGAEIAAVTSGRAHAFAPPSRTGAGRAPVPAAGLVRVAAGTYTLLGDGADLWGDSDNGVFAAVASTADKGMFVARLDSIANVNCPHLSQWAKIGLMARGDLSDDAPYIAVLVTGGNGVQVQTRAAALDNTLGTGGTAPSQSAATLTLPNTKPAANYLKKPVWLKLVRDISTWTAYTSPDGKSWTAAGAPVTLTMAGAWVGVFATSHNSSTGFKPGEQIRVAFDQLSFTPSTFVQLGTA